MTARSHRRRVVVFAVVMVGSTALAGSAIAATLRALASPASAHKNAIVTVTLGGTFRKSELRGRSGKAFLVSFSQAAAKPCRSNAVKEVAIRAFLYFRGAISHSPFSVSNTRRGDKVLKYRICAYLYPRPLTRGVNDAPLKRATVKFTVVP